MAAGGTDSMDRSWLLPGACAPASRPSLQSGTQHAHTICTHVPAGRRRPESDDVPSAGGSYTPPLAILACEVRLTNITVDSTLHDDDQLMGERQPRGWAGAFAVDCST